MAVVMANGVRSVAKVDAKMVVMAVVKLAATAPVTAVAAKAAVAAEAKVAVASVRRLQRQSFVRPAKTVAVANRVKTDVPKAVWTTPKQTLVQRAKGALTALNVVIGLWPIALCVKVAAMAEVMAAMAEMRDAPKPAPRPAPRQKPMVVLRLKPS